MRYLRRKDSCPVCNCAEILAGIEDFEKEKYSIDLYLYHSDQYGNVNYHNMIRRVIEQRGKKTSPESGWLSKTGKFPCFDSDRFD